MAGGSKSLATIPLRAEGRCSKRGVRVGDDSHLPRVRCGAGHVRGWAPGQPNDINVPSPCWLPSLQLGAGARQQLPPQHTPLPVLQLRELLPRCFYAERGFNTSRGLRCGTGHGPGPAGTAQPSKSSTPREVTPKRRPKQSWGQERATGKGTPCTYHLFSFC